MLGKLKTFDIFPKVQDDFYSTTLAGGVLTIATTAIMILLFFSELGLYLTTTTAHELTVDISRGETLTIELDVTFPYMPCEWMSLDTMDVSGDLHLDVAGHDIFKQRLTAEGAKIADPVKHDVESTKKDMELDAALANHSGCLPCFGAEMDPGQCCNTCDELRAAYHKRGWALTNVETLAQCKHDAYAESIKTQRGEGCKLFGTIQVNKVAGNFHFAPGKSYQAGGMHVHDLAPFGDALMDFSHTVNKLSFGKTFPGMRNPLDHNRVMFHSMMPPGAGAQAWGTGSATRATGMYQYFLKVVPTTYQYLDNRTINSNQFSVTENFRPAVPGAGRTLPGVFFFYDLSPIKVRIAETKHSLAHFVTGVCAIVGGVFTVSGIVDALVYQSEQLIRKKLELGKLT